MHIHICGDIKNMGMEEYKSLWDGPYFWGDHLWGRKAKETCTLFHLHKCCLPRKYFWDKYNTTFGQWLLCISKSGLLTNVKTSSCVSHWVLETLGYAQNFAIFKEIASDYSRHLLSLKLTHRKFQTCHSPGFIYKEKPLNYYEVRK